jgi:hypothetical protein
MCVATAKFTVVSSAPEGRHVAPPGLKKAAVGRSICYTYNAPSELKKL